MNGRNERAPAILIRAVYLQELWQHTRQMQVQDRYDQLASIIQAPYPEGADYARFRNDTAEQDFGVGWGEGRDRV